MPGMDGWEFLEEFNEIRFTTNKIPKVYMVTTSLNPDDQKRASENETLTGFFRKPLSNEILASILRLASDGFTSKQRKGK